MEISEKYISTTAKQTNSASKNIVLSDDAYAIVEFINELIKKIEHMRLSMIR